MQFWQLVSIFRDDPSILKHILQHSEWQMYAEWFANFTMYVNMQNREVLDRV